MSGTPFCFARNRYEPGLCLTIVVYGINMFGDAIRDLLDPRLRGGGGRYAASKRSKTVPRSSR